MATATETLLSVEQFAQIPDIGYPTELVRGRIVPLTPPQPLLGSICAEITYWLKHFLKQNDLGRVYANDTGIITQRNPDTLRGADVAFYSFDRVPKNASQARYFPSAPELVFEVLSPNDRTQDVLTKVAEYINIGVKLVCVVDPRIESIELYRADAPLQVLRQSDTFSAPDILPGFSLPVRQIFE